MRAASRVRKSRRQYLCRPGGAPFGRAGGPLIALALQADDFGGSARRNSAPALQGAGQCQQRGRRRTLVQANRMVLPFTDAAGKVPHIAPEIMVQESSFCPVAMEGKSNTKSRPVQGLICRSWSLLHRRRCSATKNQFTPRRLKIGLSACFQHADPERSPFTGKTLRYVEQSIAHWLMSAGAMVVVVPCPTGETARGA